MEEAAPRNRNFDMGKRQYYVVVVRRQDISFRSFLFLLCLEPVAWLATDRPRNSRRTTVAAETAAAQPVPGTATTVSIDTTATLTKLKTHERLRPHYGRTQLYGKKKL